MFVDAGKENEYHNMLTDGWKELIATAESGLGEFTGQVEPNRFPYVKPANKSNWKCWR